MVNAFAEPDTGQVTSIGCEGDVERAVSKPIVTCCSDPEAQVKDSPLSKTKAHPRAFGTLPRILGMCETRPGMMRWSLLPNCTTCRSHRVRTGVLATGLIVNALVRGEF